MATFNHTVIMSSAAYFSTEAAINPYYGEGTASPQAAGRELAAIKAAFEQAGMSVISVEAPATSQDGVYTANWALVRGDTAILARLPEARSSEEDHAETVLTALGKTVIRVPDGLRFSGQGDALACGDLLFCGKGYRSDEAAQAFAADRLGYQRIQLQTVPQRDAAGNPVINPVSGWPDSFFYDIDLALSVIRPASPEKRGVIAYCPEAFMPESQAVLAALDTVDKITIDYDEAVHAFAANLVSTGETIIMSAHAPKLRAAFEQLGLTVLTPEVSELAKGGGYIRCTSLSLA